METSGGRNNVRKRGAVITMLLSSSNVKRSTLEQLEFLPIHSVCKVLFAWIYGHYTHKLQNLDSENLQFCSVGTSMIASTSSQFSNFFSKKSNS